MKAFGPPKFKFHARVKECHFVNFLEWAEKAMPPSHQELECKTRESPFLKVISDKVHIF